MVPDNMSLAATCQWPFPVFCTHIFQQAWIIPSSFKVIFLPLLIPIFRCNHIFCICHINRSKEASYSEHIQSSDDQLNGCILMTEQFPCTTLHLDSLIHNSVFLSEPYFPQSLSAIPLTSCCFCTQSRIDPIDNSQIPVSNGSAALPYHY